MSLARSSSAALSPGASPMESVGQAQLAGACNLLGVPGPGPWDLDVDSDEGEVVIGIRPKSSPQPRRRSMDSDEDSEAEPPPSCGSRRVSFADAKGLSLVQVKEFGTWDVPKLPGYESSDGEEAEEFFISPLTFSLPLSTEQLFGNVRDQKVELESIELLPRTTILKGLIRVLNISFHKAIYIRTTLDAWSSHFDLLAEYVPGASDGVVDCFSFKLTLVPPFGEQGARVEFCLRYETPVGTFWANNHNRNYVLSCHQRVKDRTRRDSTSKKSCLKTASQNIPPVETLEDVPAVVSSDGEEMKTSDSHSVAAQQELKTENRQLSSRRNSRKAARTARMRDYFAQREKESADSAEAEPKVQVGMEQLADERSLSEPGSELRRLISEPPLTPSKSPPDVPHPATDVASDCQPEKPESRDHTVTPTGGEAATERAGDPLPSHDEAAPTECHSINKHACRAPGKSDNSTSDAAAKQGDGKGGRAERFGRVVAPMYQQMLGPRNPEIIGHSTGCFCHPTDVNSRLDQALRNGIHSQESDLGERDESSNIPHTEEEQADEFQGRGGSLQSQSGVAPEATNPKVKANQTSQRKIKKKGSQTEAEDFAGTPALSCDLTPNQIQHSAMEETQNICRDSLKEDLSTPRASQETWGESANYNHTSVDRFGPFKDEDMTEERTWEMMVEEEVQSILTDPEDNMVGTGAERELENGETTGWEHKPAEEGSSSGDNNTEDEDGQWIEHMERNGEDGTWDFEEEDQTNVQMEDDELEMAMFLNTMEDDVNPKDTGVEEETPNYQEDFVHGDSQVADTDLQVADSEVADADLHAADSDVALSQVADLEVAGPGFEIGCADAGIEDVYSHVAKTEVADADPEEADADSHDAESEIRDADSDTADAVLDVSVSTSETRSPATDSKGLKAEEGNYDVLNYDESFAVAQTEGEDVLSGLMPNVPAEQELCKEDSFITKQREEDYADEVECDRMSEHDSASAESDSDDEVELYMHCLRAVHTGPQGKDRGFSAGKRPSLTKLLSSPMPSISESLDEEPHLTCPQDDEDVTDFQPVAAALPLRSQSTKFHRWRATFSCSNIARALMLSTLMVLFLVTAYHYDFIACFGLYLVSVVWLYFQGEGQPAKSNNRLG